MKLVVLASGRGSNFQAMAQAVQNGTIPDTRICALVTNNPSARVIDISKRFQIPFEVIASEKFRRNDGSLDREAYDQTLVDTIGPFSPEFVCLAGYKLLLSPAFIRSFPMRILNIHPSLLPAFKGLNAQKQALDFGVQYTGCTVHLVNDELDSGPILAQNIIAIEDSDTVDSLSARLLIVEHKTYVATLQRLVSHRFHFEGHRAVWEKRA